MSTTRDDYIRVKRKNQIFFIHTSPSDTFEQIKSEISLAMGGSEKITPQQMRLYMETPKPPAPAKKNDDDEDDSDEDKVMEEKVSYTGPISDTAILSDHDVKNDAVLYVTFAKEWESGDDVPSGEDGWEEIDVANST